MPLGQTPKRRRRIESERRIRKAFLNLPSQPISADRTEYAIPKCIPQCRSRRPGQRKPQSCSQSSRPKNSGRIVVKTLRMKYAKTLGSQILQPTYLINHSNAFLVAIK